jgi:hypothetical protein
MSGELRECWRCKHAKQSHWNGRGRCFDRLFGMTCSCNRYRVAEATRP